MTLMLMLMLIQMTMLWKVVSVVRWCSKPIDGCRDLSVSQGRHDDYESGHHGSALVAPLWVGPRQGVSVGGAPIMVVAG